MSICRVSPPIIWNPWITWRPLERAQESAFRKQALGDCWCVHWLIDIDWCWLQYQISGHGLLVTHVSIWFSILMPIHFILCKDADITVISFNITLWGADFQIPSCFSRLLRVSLLLCWHHHGDIRQQWNATRGQPVSTQSYRRTRSVCTTAEVRAISRRLEKEFKSSGGQWLGRHQPSSQRWQQD